VAQLRVRGLEISRLRPLPRPEVRYLPASRVLEYDWVERPSSCLDHWLSRPPRSTGEPTDSAFAPDEAIVAASERALGSADGGAE
jgi:hypothetical protein